MSLEQHLRQELSCPITHELLQDPVTLPCCGKACSRGALITALSFRPTCPLCRADVSALNYNVHTTPRNRVIQAVVDSVDAGQGAAALRRAVPPSLGVLADTSPSYVHASFAFPVSLFAADHVAAIMFEEIPDDSPRLQPHRDRTNLRRQNLACGWVVVVVIFVLCSAVIVIPVVLLA
jgi:U-box domain